MASKTRSNYTNPFLKEKVPLVVSVATSPPSLQDAIGLHQQGQLVQAETLYRQILLSFPNNSAALHLLGVLAHQTGHYKSAIELIGKAIEFNPNDAIYYFNRGISLQELKQFEAAVISYDKAIELKPDYYKAYYNRGNSMKELKQFEAAVISYDKAISLKPDYPEAYSNRGNALKELRRYEAAVLSYDKAISLNPDLANVHFNRGNTLLKQAKVDEALESFDRVIFLNPSHCQVYISRGVALRLKHQYVDALDSVSRALEINPDVTAAQQGYSSMLSYLSDYREVCRYSETALSLATDTERPVVWAKRLFHWIYHPDLSAQEICDEHERWGRNYAHLGQAGFADHDRTPKRRLRIGYVSPDFRGHTCRFYFEPLFSQHDHTDFEVFAYSSVLHEDEHTQRLKPYFDHWRDIHCLTDEAAAQMIRQDRIDILVDGCGHMMDTRLTVFAHKPAPIQVTWLGAAWTTGLPQMDYVLFDPYMAPEGTTTSEQIVCLPRTWAAFRPGERATQASVKVLPALTKGYVTFGYSGRSERLNHRVFKAWSRILARLPMARLVLDYKAFIDPKTQAYYKEFLQKHAVDTSRVIMRNSENIFEGLGDIDILLDSFPHSGGTMLFDAIWMGVPALTLASPRPVGRIGTSLMTNLGLHEWVAQDEQEYEDKAVTFAQDITTLASLRNGMRAKMQASPVMDERAFAHDVENAFETMWRNWVDSSNQELLTGRNH
jgi:protein O-GlcNAc transferase